MALFLADFNYFFFFFFFFLLQFEWCCDSPQLVDLVHGLKCLDFFEIPMEEVNVERNFRNQRY